MLALLLLNGVLLALIVWRAIGSNEPKASNSPPSEPAAAVNEEARAVETNPPRPSPSRPSPPERVRVQEALVAPAPPAPNLVAPPTVANSTPEVAANARGGIAQGLRSLTNGILNHADGGIAGPK